MQILFFSVPIMDYSGGRLIPSGQDFPPNCPSLSTYLLASVVRNAGHDVIVVDFVATGDITLNFEELEDVDLFAISATSLNWPAVLDIVGKLRAQDLTAPIVIGGIHPTMFSKYILTDYTTIDFVIRNEGELAIVALCAALETGTDLSEVPNLSWRNRHGEIVENPFAAVLDKEALASLSIPAYDLMPAKIYPSLPVQSSRGCPFSCSFCSTSHRHSYRGIPVQSFVDHLEQILLLGEDKLMEPNLVQIIDDEWSVNRKRSIAILREMDRRGLPVQMTYDSRANDFLYDDGYIELVAPRTAGLLIGAECGYDEGLKRIGKGTTIVKLTECAELLSRYGIAERAEFSFILGLPWESKDDCLKTVNFAFTLAHHFGVTILLQWYWQLPGSYLWDESFRKGIVTPAMYNEFGFFRNLYLFTTGNQLSPDEVWEVVDVIETLRSLFLLNGHDQAAIRTRPPAPIEINFPHEMKHSWIPSSGHLIRQKHPRT